MAVAHGTGRSRYRLILLALTAVTLLTLDFRGFGPLESAQRGLRDVTEPIVGAADTVFGPVGDAWNAAFDYGDLKSENDELRQRLDELEGQRIQSAADRAAYEALLEATGLDYVGDLPTVAAQVIRGGVGNFDDDVVTIDRGADDGVEPGMAVVTGAGFVGRIDRVDGSTSTVTLASDSSLAIGVRVVDIDRVGLARPVPGGERLLLIDQGIDWPDDADAGGVSEVGAAVVTAAESRYPADIPVGEVVAVAQGEGGTQQIRVRLAAAVDDLNFVSVVLVADPDEIDSTDVDPSNEEDAG